MTSGDTSSIAPRRRVVLVVLAAVTVFASSAVITILALGGGKTVPPEVTTRGDVAPPPAPVTGPAKQPGATVPCASGTDGPLREDTRFTTDGGTTVPFSISLPAGYYRGCRTYPVLYALHGKDENNASFMGSALHLRRAMDAGVLDQAIIVTPDSFSVGRWENRDTGPAEDNVIKYLIPHVEQTYRVRPGAPYRLLVGFSMGGHGALRFGLKYSRMFAGVWSVDGAMSREPSDYLPLVEGKSSDEVHIVAAGGQLNGSRVEAALEALEQAGITIPYTYRDREHAFEAFVDEDEKAGWPAARYLQERVGRPL
jgi:enterochelin esterase-like enzyme